jgi:valyl-tRNA synthetase
VTPAHDPNDFEIGRRHDLPSLDVMTPEAVITGTGTPFDGMDRFEAAPAVREALREQGRIGAEKRPVPARRRATARGARPSSSRG